MIRSLDIYNLEFRCHCNEMTIFGYRFGRVAEYRERLLSLMHGVHSVSEYNVPINTGGHALTATVEFSTPEHSAVLGWADSDAAALQDVTLLLSLFTSRSVFVVDPAARGEDDAFFVTHDPRQYAWGGILVTSLPYVCALGNGKTEQERHRKSYDKGLEIYLNEIYDRIREPAWLEEYRRGHFLLLYKWAVQQRTVDAAFIHCWTIWEHLFAVLNDSWMSRAHIQKANASEKISYLLVRFAFRKRLQESEKKRLEEIAEIRNRLIHFGMFPEREKVHADAVMFVRMTEYLIAQALGLTPSNIFNTIEEFESFLTATARKARADNP